MADTDLKKKREILFSKFPPGQVPEAADAERVFRDMAGQGNKLIEHLVDKGFHLDNTLFTKLTRALIYYVEDTQLHNIGAPEKRLKRSAQEAYVHAWEHHPHGDHDDTPPEWREYK